LSPVKKQKSTAKVGLDIGRAVTLTSRNKEATKAERQVWTFRRIVKREGEAITR